MPLRNSAVLHVFQNAKMKWQAINLLPKVEYILGKLPKRRPLIKFRIIPSKVNGPLTLPVLQAWRQFICLQLNQGSIGLIGPVHTFEQRVTSCALIAHKRGGGRCGCWFFWHFEKRLWFSSFLSNYPFTVPWTKMVRLKNVFNLLTQTNNRLIVL